MRHAVPVLPVKAIAGSPNPRKLRTGITYYAPEEHLLMKETRLVDHTWKVICFDAVTGNNLWTKDSIQSKPRSETHRNNLYASETPATDGKHIVGAKTGAKIYDERLPDAGAFWASPWSFNGSVYCPDEQSNNFVLKPGRKLELVCVHKLTEENARYWATSAAGDGALYIR